LTHGTRIYLATDATDMRRGFNGLQGQISSVLQQDPLSGHLFLFVNRRRDKLKILYWDADGFAIWYKRLESGSFQVPSFQPDQTHVEIKSDELMMLLRGIDLSSKRRKRYSLESEPSNANSSNANTPTMVPI
jgi:transposase